jgi:antitoxin component of MazEF toxin-antitoxin module
MARVKVGKWGKNLAIRIPQDVADVTGLSDGEQVEIQAKDGDLVVTRPAARDRSDAIKAAEEIRRARKGFSLGGLSIKDMINEGRK